MIVCVVHRLPDSEDYSEFETEECETCGTLFQLVHDRWERVTASAN